MGLYFNPSNESFTQARNSQVFVYKTGLIEYLNKIISTEEKCIALSHARRFGKSHAAGMIDAYYSLGCDSTKLFEDTEIAGSSDFKKYMNQYNVIHIDVSSFWDTYKDNIVEKIIEYICGCVIYTDHKICHLRFLFIEYQRINFMAFINSYFVCAYILFNVFLKRSQKTRHSFNCCICINHFLNPLKNCLTLNQNLDQKVKYLCLKPYWIFPC